MDMNTADVLFALIIADAPSTCAPAARAHATAARRGSEAHKAEACWPYSNGAVAIAASAAFLCPARPWWWPTRWQSLLYFVGLAGAPPPPSAGGGGGGDASPTERVHAPPGPAASPPAAAWPAAAPESTRAGPVDRIGSIHSEWSP